MVTPDIAVNSSSKLSLQQSLRQTLETSRGPGVSKLSFPHSEPQPVWGRLAVPGSWLTHGGAEITLPGSPSERSLCRPEVRPKDSKSVPTWGGVARGLQHVPSARGRRACLATTPSQDTRPRQRSRGRAQGCIFVPKKHFGKGWAARQGENREQMSRREAVLQHNLTLRLSSLARWYLNRESGR